MEEKSYEVDKMLDTLIDLASTEVEKAKQRGYFGKDFVEATTMVIALAKNQETGGMGGYGTYGNRRNDYPGYGNYDRGYGEARGYGDGRGYGHYDETEEEYGKGATRGRRGGYGRSGERYG